MAKYVSAARAAALLGLNEKTVRSMIERGELQAVRITAKRFNVSMDEIRRMATKRGIELEQDTEVSIAALDLEVMQLRERVEQLEHAIERLQIAIERPVRTERVSHDQKVKPHPTAAQSTKNALPGVFPDKLPPGSIRFQDFLAQHGLKEHRRYIAGYLDAPGNGLHFESFPGRTEHEKERYLTPEQQEKLLEWLRARHPELLG
jgi:hypothetical protein